MPRAILVRTLAAVVLATLPAVAAARTVEADLEFQGREVRLDLQYAQRVVLKVWDEPRIRVRAVVDLEDRDGVRDQDFRWRLSEDGAVATVLADFGVVEKHTVLLREGTDLSNGIPEGSLVTGTDLTIWLPKGVGVDAKSTTGRFDVDHNGGALFVDTIGSITVRLGSTAGVTVSASTVIGTISLAEELEVVSLSRESEEAGNGYGRQMLFEIAGGGAELSLVSIVGTIRLEPRSLRGRSSKGVDP